MPHSLITLYLFSIWKNIMLINRVLSDNKTLISVASPIAGYGIMFNAGSYTSWLKAPEYEDVFDLVNVFFSTQSYRYREIMFTMYEEVYGLIKQAVPKSYDDTEQDIQEEISSALARTDLLNGLLNFCIHNGNIIQCLPDLSIAGTLDHHDEERTFGEDEYLSMTTLSLFCKMMIPIWSQLKLRLTELKYTPYDIDQMCLDLIHPIVKNSTLCLPYYKLTYMIKTVVEGKLRYWDKKASQYKKSIGSSSHVLLDKGDLTVNDLEYLSLSTSLCRRLVKFNPISMDSNANILVYLDDGIKRTTDSVLTELKNRQ